MNNTISLLKELSTLVCVSGNETQALDYLTNILSNYGDVTVDSMNNIFCTFGEGMHFLLDAHLDEIGMIVTSITDDGFIKFDKCGGIDVRTLLGTEVSVWGSNEIKGVISTLPPHLQSADDEKKVPEIKELSVDTGFTAKELENLVKPGDNITVKRNFTQLINNRISASCLDDRAGVAALLCALDDLKKLPCKITILLSSQEELGTRGAKIGPYGKNVDEAIAVDVSFAYTPGCDKNDCGELSKGAMIGFSPILNNEMSKMLVEVAEKHNIPYQKEIMSGKTGTNADVITVSQAGIKTALISIPEKYMHQSVEVVDIADVDAVSKLITCYISERVGDSNA